MDGVHSQIDNSAVANGRSSLPEIALSAIHNIFWCGRIPLIFRCSLKLISKFSRCSRIGRREILHAGSGNPTLFHSATSLTPALSADFSGIFFLLRTSKVTYHHLLSASEPAPQAKCRKCRRHGGWVNRPVRIFPRSFYGRRRFAN